VPFKERVVPMVDRSTEEAHATGAVDTITREGARLVGHNTDVLGFRPALDALVGKQRMPKLAVVLGAGGGARAAVYGLITAGFQHVYVFNRHLHRGEALVRHFARSAAHMELKAKPWHESVLEAELSRTKVLINASSVGRTAEETPIPAELLPPDLLVLDLLYTPKETRLVREARAAGAAAATNGDVMLLHQTAAAFNLWTGQAAPMDLLAERLETARDEAVPAADAAAPDA
jgi:shikimate dehydrogenase